MNARIVRISSHPLLTTLLAAAVGVAVVQSASSQTLLNDDFESYADDASLLSFWSRVSGTSASIFLTPDPLNAENQVIEQTTAAGRLRNIITGTVATDANPLVFSFDFYDATSGTANGRNYAEIRNSAVAAGLFAAGLYNSVNTGVLDTTKYQARNVDNGGWIQLDAPRSVGWHNFRFEILGNTVDLYVDNVLDPQFTDRSYAGNVTYDWVHVGSALTGNSMGYFDNVSVAVVPEPSAIALGLLGLGTLLGSAWLRRR